MKILNKNVEKLNKERKMKFKIRKKKNTQLKSKNKSLIFWQRKLKRNNNNDTVVHGWQAKEEIASTTMKGGMTNWMRQKTK